eukprot:NODE_117_length_18329_cov_0.420954.p3 type:complete len:493 gc:universal NODE_117_length_18329_cov_0.420954:5983-4505(-)
MLFQLIYSISIDCPALKNFIIELNMHIVNPVLYNKLTTGDCCGADYVVVNGITCLNARILQINFRNLNLNGTISSNASVPNIDGLNGIYFGTNKISGNLPAMGASMTWYEMGRNNFNGTLVPLNPNMVNFPASAWVNVRYNQLYGSIPSWTNGLNFFYASYNKLSGPLPPTPLSYIASEIDFAGNMLSGTITATADILFAISFNLFTGSLTFNKPKSLLIQNNGFTSLTIADSSLLTTANCNLTQNAFDYSSLSAFKGKCLLDAPSTTTLETSSSSTTKSTSALVIQATTSTTSSSKTSVLLIQSAKTNPITALTSTTESSKHIPTTTSDSTHSAYPNSLSGSSESSKAMDILSSAIIIESSNLSSLSAKSSYMSESVSQESLNPFNSDLQPNINTVPQRVFYKTAKSSLDLLTFNSVLTSTIENIKAETSRNLPRVSRNEIVIYQWSIFVFLKCFINCMTFLTVVTYLMRRAATKKHHRHRTIGFMDVASS